MPLRTRSLSWVAATLLSLPLLGACSGDESSDDATAATPAEVVAGARQELDKTSGLTITLATDDLPDGVTGITSAEGEAAHPPAFKGTFDLSAQGFPAEAEVIAVDGTTYAKNSLLLPDWTQIDPADYGAPDPVVLMTPDQGFSALLDAVTGVTKGKQTRGGTDNKEILTSYTGTVSGEAASGIIPTAEGDVDVTMLITDDGQLRELDATGTFYGADNDASTYTIGFDDYGSKPDISAP